MIQIPEHDLRQAIIAMQQAEYACTNAAAKAKLRIYINILSDYLPEALEEAIWNNMYLESKTDQHLSQP